eukprot:TRINITY_DN25424_c0_g1_i1.p1 TRINITY_DN25424_c0_g1~~TRINITY_DN25424_c0_g1_i1.p1  ORF type:complete len:316 (-),score=41.72 TRINITY_DN25424_c0_g1_i1:212-1159(-)
MEISNAVLSRPLSEILHDAADAEILRRRVQELEMRLDESAALVTSLSEELEAESQRRMAAEKALFQRTSGGTLKAANRHVSALKLALGWLELTDFVQVSLTCSDAYDYAQKDWFWQNFSTVCVDRVQLYNCRNFKSAVLASHASSKFRQMESTLLYKIEDLTKSLFENTPSIHWIITLPRLQTSFSDGGKRYSILSPKFDIRGMKGCQLEFQRGSKRNRSSFYFLMPHWTEMKASVQIEHCSPVHMDSPHHFTGFDESFGIDTGPSFTTFQNHLMIKVTFQLIRRFGDTSDSNFPIYIQTNKYSKVQTFTGSYLL